MKFNKTPNGECQKIVLSISGLAKILTPRHLCDKLGYFRAASALLALHSLVVVTHSAQMRSSPLFLLAF